jgi:hypothetical protein
MAYRPPHRRGTAEKKPTALVDAQGLGPLRRQDDDRQQRGPHSLTVMNGFSRAGPCAVVRTQMSRTRPCASWADQLPPGTSLLGCADEFCDAFFHVSAPPRPPPAGQQPLPLLTVSRFLLLRCAGARDPGGGHPAVLRAAAAR